MLKFATSIMREALLLAKSDDSLDLPIAAVICDETGKILSSSVNQVVRSRDSTAHAELLALQEVAVAAPRAKIATLTLAATLEPCPMCAWAIKISGIRRLVFGAYNSNYGAAGSTFDLLRDPRFGQSVEVVGGVLENECSQLLDDAFIRIRNNKGR